MVPINGIEWRNKPPAAAVYGGKFRVKPKTLRYDDMWVAPNCGNAFSAQFPGMIQARTPPFLLGVTVLFWGWQTGFLPIAGLMAVLLEAPRWVKTRWEISEEDFGRIWTLCTLAFLATALFAFTANEGPMQFRGLLQNPNPNSTRGAGVASARTAAALIRWLPMTFLLFMAAQLYSARERVPLETISLILRLRWKKAMRLGKALPERRSADISYIYFALCLFSASIHPADNAFYFWGVCVLLGWALWPLRSVRFSPVTWVLTMGLVVGFGFLGQKGVGVLQRYVENLNPQWFSRFSRQGFDANQARTSIGHIGMLKQSGRVCIRVEVQPGSVPPPLLREASYRAYKSQTWFAAVGKTGYEAILEDVTNRTAWVLVNGKTNPATATISSYLPGGVGLLPLPAGCGRLEHLSAFGLQKNELGAIMAQGPGLVVFDALYGPGASLDSPPDQTEDTYIPPTENRALEAIIEELDVAGKSRAQILRKLNDFFQDNFKYSIWDGVRHRRSRESALTRFLLRTRSGHCEYFASASVLLLRKLNIPARYAVGYAVHEKVGDRSFVVRQRDAHAWCLVWNEDKGIWQDFDATPGSWVEAEAARASTFQRLSDFWDNIWFQVSKFRWGQTNLRKYILIGTAPILTILLVQVIFKRRARARKQTGAENKLAEIWPGQDSDFYQLEVRLSQAGVERRSSEALTDWLERATKNPNLVNLRGKLRSLLHLHYRHRFDPLGLPTADRELLRQETRSCLLSLQGVSPHY
jgi:hypothetical protein